MQKLKTTNKSNTKIQNFKQLRIRTYKIQNYKHLKSKKTHPTLSKISYKMSYKNLPQKSEDPLTIIFKSAMGEVIKTRSKSTAVQSARVERVLEVSIDNQLKSVNKCCIPTYKNFNKYMGDEINKYKRIKYLGIK